MVYGLHKHTCDDIMHIYIYTHMCVAACYINVLTTWGPNSSKHHPQTKISLKDWVYGHSYTHQNNPNSTSKSAPAPHISVEPHCGNCKPNLYQQ